MIPITGKLDILLKSITLLTREHEMGTKTDKSDDLVKTILGTMRDNRNKNIVGGETTKLDELSNLISNIMNHPDSHDRDSIIQALTIMLKDTPDTVTNFSKQLKQDLSNNQMLRSIVTLRNALNDYYIHQQIINAVNKANYQLSTGRLDNMSIKEFNAKLITTLEAFDVSGESKDPGIVDELDIENTDAMGTVFDKTIQNTLGNSKLKFGFKCFNVMTQGGGRRGEMCMLNALQHQYKSGTCQSLFMQVPRYNKPIMLDPTKKPLVIYISCEDDTTVYTGFMYKYLYYNKFKKIPDLSMVTPEEMAKFLKDELSINGYNVMMMKVNPSDWSIKHLFNKILQLEAKGFEIHALFIDYLAKLPTIGCTNTGPGGTDVRDMFNRFRNFFSTRETFTLTPHQISTEAKQLVRNGTPDTTFVKEIVGKGYTELSKQLDQVVDLEFYQHKAKINGKWHLTFQRGKHRTPGILDDDKMYAVMPFPYNAPIVEDVNEDGEDIVIPKDGEEFDF